MPYSEHAIHLERFEPSEVFDIGCRIETIPPSVMGLSVSFEPGFESLEEGLGVYAAISLLGKPYKLTGEVGVHDELRNHVAIYLGSKAAEANLELSLTENRPIGGTIIHSSLRIDVLKGGIAGAALRPVVQQQMDRIQPAFAKEHSENVERLLVIRNQPPRRRAA